MPGANDLTIMLTGSRDILHAIPNPSPGSTLKSRAFTESAQLQALAKPIFFPVKCFHPSLFLQPVTTPSSCSSPSCTTYEGGPIVPPLTVAPPAALLRVAEIVPPVTPAPLSVPTNHPANKQRWQPRGCLAITGSARVAVSAALENQFCALSHSHSHGHF
jgi:hypothetical protein